MSGQITKKVNGKERTFKFGMNAWIIYCELHNIQFGEMFEHWATNPGVTRDIIYSGAKAGGEQEITKEDVGDWLDEMPEKDQAAIVKAFEDSKLVGKKVQEWLQSGEETPEKE